MLGRLNRARVAERLGDRDGQPSGTSTPSMPGVTPTRAPGSCGRGAGPSRAAVGGAERVSRGLEPAGRLHCAGERGAQTGVSSNTLLLVRSPHRHCVTNRVRLPEYRERFGYESGGMVRAIRVYR